METASVSNTQELLASRHLQRSRPRAIAAPPQQGSVQRTPLGGVSKAAALKGEGVQPSTPQGPTPVNAGTGGPDPVKLLFGEWGKSGSNLDLDGSGKVGIGDFLKMLGTMQAPPPAEPNPMQDQVEGLIADWGKTESTNDLDGSGKVGINDFLQMLGTMEVEPPQETNPMQERLDALLADWGKTGSEHDLDGDGTVGINDFLTMLGRMGGEEAQQAPDPADPQSPQSTGTPVGELQRIRAAYDHALAENIARSLLPQLSESEPGALRQAIDESDLPQGRKTALLEQLASYHPRGFNLSLVG